MLEILLARPVLAAPLAVLALACAVYATLLRNRARRLPDVPIVGARRGEWFPLVRARWRNALDMKPVLVAAYQQHKHETCIVPALGAEDYVVLPVAEMQWFLDQPDAVFSLRESLRRSLLLDYTVPDVRITQPSLHAELVSRRLTREAGNLVPALVDEIAASVDDIWGADPSAARDVCVYATAQRIVGRVTNRAVVGLPLCRDETLLDCGVAFATDIPLTSKLLRLVPAWLRPVAALPVTLPTRIHAKRFRDVLRGEIERRLGAFDARQQQQQQQQRGDPDKPAHLPEPPNDFLEWLVAQGRAHGERDEYFARPDTLAGRMLMLNFAAIHTSSFAMTHALLDVAYRMTAADLALLRREIAAARPPAAGGAWDKRALAAMPRLDSVLRESQRLNSFVTVATSRVVVAKDGVTTPSGVELRPGTAVVAHAYPVMRGDEEHYDAPGEFRPFRFVGARAQAFATTGADFLAFGHGRHACPGRFFASTELRLMLAYMVMNYDFVVQRKDDDGAKGGRPRNKWYGIHRVPDMEARIKVVRRDSNKD